MEKLVKIPRPEFFVFYNGTKDMEAEKVLKLSDAYVDNDSENPLSLELIVRVININSNSGSEVQILFNRTIYRAIRYKK